MVVAPALSFQPTVNQTLPVIGPVVVVCEIELPVPTIGVACPSVAGAATRRGPSETSKLIVSPGQCQPCFALPRTRL
jgi:hypothetical protein